MQAYTTPEGVLQWSQTNQCNQISVGCNTNWDCSIQSRIQWRHTQGTSQLCHRLRLFNNVFLHLFKSCACIKIDLNFTSKINLFAILSNHLFTVFCARREWHPRLSLGRGVAVILNITLYLVGSPVNATGTALKPLNGLNHD